MPLPSSLTGNCWRAHLLTGDSLGPSADLSLFGRTGGGGGGIGVNVREGSAGVSGAICDDLLTAGAGMQPGIPGGLIGPLYGGN